MLLILVCLGAGLLLLFFSSSGGDNSEKNGEELHDAATSAKEWCRYLEDEAERLCRSVDGVGDVTVVVTLSGSFGQVYAANTEIRDGGTDSKYVTVGSGASAHLCQTGVTMPQIAGVGIVCGGAVDAGVKAELTALVAAAFGVGTNKIYVTGAG